MVEHGYYCKCCNTFGKYSLYNSGYCEECYEGDRELSLLAALIALLTAIGASFLAFIKN